jgi:hypothetical protein
MDDPFRILVRRPPPVDRAAVAAFPQGMRAAGALGGLPFRAFPAFL